MARNDPADALRLAVERQAGFARALSGRIGAQARQRLDLDQETIEFMVEMSEVFDRLARALTRAGADYDRVAVGRWSRIGKSLAIPIAAIGGLAGGAAQGAGQAAYEDLFGDDSQIVACAANLVASADAASRVAVSPAEGQSEFPQSAIGGERFNRALLALLERHNWSTVAVAKLIEDEVGEQVDPKLIRNWANGIGLIRPSGPLIDWIIDS